MEVVVIVCEAYIHAKIKRTVSSFSTFHFKFCLEINHRTSTTFQRMLGLSEYMSCCNGSNDSD